METITAYQWDFGDGIVMEKTVSLKKAQYVYVQLAVSDTKSVDYLQNALNEKYKEGYRIFSHHIDCSQGCVFNVFIMELRETE